MKWYRVDKHDIPGDCDLIVYCPEYCWERLMIARHEYIEGSSRFYLNKYDDPGKRERGSLITSDVTHFCIPEPVEIE